jgi:thiamine biosynthesis lipoprotein ApbE
MTRLVAWCTLILASVGFASCAPKPSEAPEKSNARLFERAGLTMGSELKLTAWSADETSVQKLFDDVFAEFDRLDRLMSVWKEGSDILRLNAAAGDHPAYEPRDIRGVADCPRRQRGRRDDSTLPLER